MMHKKGNLFLDIILSIFIVVIIAYMVPPLYSVLSNYYDKLVDAGASEDELRPIDKGKASLRLIDQSSIIVFVLTAAGMSFLASKIFPHPIGIVVAFVGAGLLIYIFALNANTYDDYVQLEGSPMNETAADLPYSQRFMREGPKWVLIAVSLGFGAFFVGRRVIGIG